MKLSRKISEILAKNNTDMLEKFGIKALKNARKIWHKYNQI